ncbi:PaaI family thioesterase [Pusillimonas minor]|uniref:Medium/long-chain acyl-CoA thioesterase YigI n=1 Tax=Pusillimonas minor TaxID=2697024 RepID=A0A842HMI5_9BURK|nr:PaaI family thioesterase [Pusillimonas minor]MBC2769527.1 PaaI family thioesterase [Pusillimonas minor]
MSKESTDYFGLNIPFMQFIGLQPEDFSPQLTRTRLPWRADLTNSRGDIHGGTLMSALDLTLSAAARANDTATSMATIDMTSHFLAPARGTVVFEATCLRMGRSIAFCEGRALSEDGELLVTATATFKVMRPR